METNVSKVQDSIKTKAVVDAANAMKLDVPIDDKESIVNIYSSINEQLTAALVYLNKVEPNLPKSLLEVRIQNSRFQLLRAGLSLIIIGENPALTEMMKENYYVTYLIKDGVKNFFLLTDKVQTSICIAVVITETTYHLLCLFEKNRSKIIDTYDSIVSTPDESTGTLSLDFNEMYMKIDRASSEIDNVKQSDAAAPVVATPPVMDISVKHGIANVPVVSTSIIPKNKLVEMFGGPSSFRGFTFNDPIPEEVFSKLIGQIGLDMVADIIMGKSFASVAKQQGVSERSVRWLYDKFCEYVGSICHSFIFTSLLKTREYPDYFAKRALAIVAVEINKDTDILIADLFSNHDVRVEDLLIRDNVDNYFYSNGVIMMDEYLHYPDVREAVMLKVLTSNESVAFFARMYGVNYSKFYGYYKANCARIDMAYRHINSGIKKIPRSIVTVKDRKEKVGAGEYDALFSYISLEMPTFWFNK